MVEAYQLQESIRTTPPRPFRHGDGEIAHAGRRRLILARCGTTHHQRVDERKMLK